MPLSLNTIQELTQPYKRLSPKGYGSKETHMTIAIIDPRQLTIRRYCKSQQ